MSTLSHVLKVQLKKAILLEKENSAFFGLRFKRGKYDFMEGGGEAGRCYAEAPPRKNYKCASHFHANLSYCSEVGEQ